MFNFSWPLAELAYLRHFSAQREPQNCVPLWPDFSSHYLLLAQTDKSYGWSETNDFLTENFTDLDFSFAETLELKENPFSSEKAFEMEPKILRFFCLREKK